MSTLGELKDWLHRRIGKTDKLLVILSSFDKPCQIKEIKLRGEEAGLKTPPSSSISSLLNSTNGLAIRTNVGWEITSKGRDHLLTLGVPLQDSLSKTTSSELRDHLATIKDPLTKAFFDETILCVEHGLHRAAVVMSWSATIHVLRLHIIKKHLLEFNNEAMRVNPKWKIAKNEDDLSLMKESDFLDRLEGISLIGKDVKKQLKSCLELRNSCGHPNSLKIEKLKVASHIETLIQNVFMKFT